MKYILKKHSPDAKAGQIYHLGLKNAMCGHNNPHILYHDTDPHGKANFDIGGVDVSEWFEEVKPREFYINKTKNGLLHAYYKENSALEGASLDDSETIKVVECI